MCLYLEQSYTNFLGKVLVFHDPGKAVAFLHLSPNEKYFWVTLLLRNGKEYEARGKGGLERGLALLGALAESHELCIELPKIKA